MSRFKRNFTRITSLFDSKRNEDQDRPSVPGRSPLVPALGDHGQNLIESLRNPLAGAGTAGRSAVLDDHISLIPQAEANERANDHHAQHDSQEASTPTDRHPTGRAEAFPIQLPALAVQSAVNLASDWEASSTCSAQARS